MLLASRGQSVEFKFIFVSEGNIYDPTNLSTPKDIYFSVVRGDYGNGPIIDGPYSYLNQEATPSSDIYIEKINSYEFVFHYVIPNNIFEGVYSVLAQTDNSLQTIAISSPFQVKGEPITLNPVIVSPQKTTVVNYKADYDQLNGGNTSTILLIGHADGIGINEPVRVRSMQSAIDLLGADLRSPLLRGVFNAYAAGARDILICAAAPMLEYVENYSDRLNSTTMFDLSSATPSSYTFYEKYYERLEATYSLIEDLDFVDIVVPLETSIIKTGEIDFVTQLANYCQTFHNNTGYVQMGVIGSRTNGVSQSDIDIIEADSVLANKLTEYSPGGSISSDKGRFVVPVYGEAVYQHSELKTSYVSSIAASLAGMMASKRLGVGLVRIRIPGAMSLYGSDLTQQDFNRLENICINSVYRGKKTRRSVPFEVYLSNEYTLAAKNSTLSKLAQMRIIAYVVSNVKEYSYNAIGKFGYDKFVDSVRNLLIKLKSDKAILDFSFNVEISTTDRGAIICYIELLSALGLKKLSFSIATGPGV